MTNLEKLAQAIDEGMNEINYRLVDGGMTLTIGHSISTDNTVTLFLPMDVEMVIWAEDTTEEGDIVNGFHAS